MKQLQCERCKAKWQRRTRRKPVQCPRCHSPYWDKPRTQRQAMAITGLYLAAMKTCHDLGLPWTDPRTGRTYQPRKKGKR